MKKLNDIVYNTRRIRLTGDTVQSFVLNNFTNVRGRNIVCTFNKHRFKVYSHDYPQDITYVQVEQVEKKLIDLLAQPGETGYVAWVGSNIIGGSFRRDCDVMLRSETKFGGF